MSDARSEARHKVGMKLKMRLQKGPMKRPFKKCPNKSLKYKCKEQIDGEECPYIGGMRYHLNMHMKQMHLRIRDLKCDRYALYRRYDDLNIKCETIKQVTRLEDLSKIKI